MSKKDNMKICPECGRAIDKRGFHNHINSNRCYATKMQKKMKGAGWMRVKHRKYYEYLKRNDMEMEREYTNLFQNSKCPWTYKLWGEQLVAVYWAPRKNMKEAMNEVLPHTDRYKNREIQFHTTNYMFVDDELYEKREPDHYQRRKYVKIYDNEVYDIRGHKIAQGTYLGPEQTIQDVEDDEERELLFDMLVALRI